MSKLVFCTSNSMTNIRGWRALIHCLDIQVVSVTLLDKHSIGGISTKVAPGPGKSKVCPFNPRWYPDFWWRLYRKTRTQRSWQELPCLIADMSGTERKAKEKTKPRCKEVSFLSHMVSEKVSKKILKRWKQCWRRQPMWPVYGGSLD